MSADAVPSELASLLERVNQNEAKKECSWFTNERAIDSGQALIGIEKFLRHGQFRPFVEKHVVPDYAQCVDYMEAARNRHLLDQLRAGPPWTYMTLENFLGFLKSRGPEAGHQYRVFT